MNYNTIEIEYVPFDTIVRAKDHFGNESEFGFTDDEANNFVSNMPSDYYVIDKRNEPEIREYVRDFRTRIK